MKTKAFGVAALLVLLTACGESSGSGVTSSSLPTSEPSSSVATSSSVSSSTPSSSVISSSSVESGFTSSSEYTAPSVSVGGILDDLGMDVIALVTGKSYAGSIVLKNYTDPTINVSFVGPDILTIVGDMKTGLTITGDTAGGTVVTFKDASDHMLYRTAINVRDRLTPTEVLNYAYEDVRSYVPIYSAGDNYSITFTSPTAGLFYAKEGDYDYGTQSFTVTISDTSSSAGTNEYYVLTVTMDSTSAPLMLSEIFLAVNGSGLIPFDNNYTTVNLFKATF